MNLNPFDLHERKHWYEAFLTALIFYGIPAALILFGVIWLLQPEAK